MTTSPGMLPRFAMVLFGACAIGPAPSAFAQMGTVEGTIALEAMRQPAVAALYRTRTSDPIRDPDPPRAIVYLEQVPEERNPERQDGGASSISDDAVVTVSQEGYQFRPGLTAVQTGAQVSFPNLDNEFHSVFSYSPAKRFDLGRYRKDEESPLVVFDEPGVVRVYCEIHKHMRSLLLVLDTPWFTATDPAGRFLLKSIPAGRYRIRAFLPSERTLETQVAVVANQVVRIDLRDDLRNDLRNDLGNER